MKKLLFALAAFCFTLSASQVFAFSVSDYYSTHRPNNLADTIAASNEGYIPCTRLLEQFHKAYSYMANTINMEGDGKVSPAQPIGSESVRSWAELKYYSEIEFDKCLSDYNAENEAEREAEEAKAAEEQAKKEAEEAAIAKRLADIQKALDECDFNFFDSMSNSEKMDTFDEREACKNKPAETVTETTIQTTAPTNYTPPTPVVQEVQRTYTPETINHPDQTDTEVLEVTETEATTSETISVTPEQLEEMVQERVNEATPTEPAPEPKPSVFKRVINFLFGWMF